MKKAQQMSEKERAQARKVAMPEVKALIKKHGKSVVYGCLVKLSAGGRPATK